MRKKTTALARFIILFSLIICSLCVNSYAKQNDNYNDKIIGDIKCDYLVQPQVNWESYKQKIKVKGIYATANSIANIKSFNRLLGIVKSTEINTLVIDIKDDYGLLSYRPDVQIVRDNGLDKRIKIKDFYDRIETLKQNNVYLIARIVTFKDTNMGSKRPDLAIKSKSGRVWKDNKGNIWLNPFNKESWDYPISIAKDAALNGFDEIQFDYVRFPTGSGKANINYGEAEKTTTKADAISGFLTKAKAEIESLGAYVSADIFGDIINNNRDSGIGQNLERLSASTHILCPMIYPSHYAKGSYGVKYPDTNPYPIIYNAMTRAKGRINKLNISDRAILRPWLQDFSATWLKRDYGANWIPYKKPQIIAQIKATKDAGIDEWIFWNPSNKYTIDAFQPVQ
ncbi:putative glycoside hydrolase [Clostridiaceae bacterium M8S5]|nr:putative glycoside hydrolase [Clostridiaceae bacterium M8S5]